MLLYVLLASFIGVEAGYSLPSVGYNNINSGVAFTLYATRYFKCCDFKFGFNTSFYQGKNISYSLSSYGARLEVVQNNWRISPLLTLGYNYINAKIDNTAEVGFAFDYDLGLAINFRHDNLLLSPGLYYQGVTDLSYHAGFIGIKLGIGYEFGKEKPDEELFEDQ